VALGAVFLGGMAPDLDEPSAQVWRRLPAGSGTIIGRVVAPVFGSHRFISHSLLGMVIFGWLAKKVLEISSGVLVVDQVVVWWAFMMGVASHLMADALTKEGVPFFFPIPIKLGFPPIKFLRITTGEWVEKLVFVGLIFLNGWLIHSYADKFIGLLRMVTK
jgi:inner membrane protein